MRKQLQKTPQIQFYPTSELSRIHSWIGEFGLTVDRTLISGVNLSGIEIQSLDTEQAISLSKKLSQVFARIGVAATVTLYYINKKAPELKQRRSGDQTSDMIEASRLRMLNSTFLVSTEIIVLFEMSLDDSLNRVNPAQLAATLFDLVSKKNAIASLKQMFSIKDHYLVSEADLQEKLNALEQLLQTFSDDIGNLCEARPLTKHDIYGLSTYLLSFESPTKNDDLTPSSNVGAFTATGDVFPVKLDGKFDAVKLATSNPRYARIASIIRFNKRPLPGLMERRYDEAAVPITSVVGEYLICFRFKALTDFEQAFMFTRRKNELDRSSIDFPSVFGRGGTQPDPNATGFKDTELQSKYDELEEAKSLRVKWTSSECYVVAHSDSPKALQSTVRQLTQSMLSSGFNHTWESVHLMDAFTAIQPVGSKASLRKLTTNHNQNAVIAPLYKPPSGQKTVPGVPGHLPQMILTDHANRPFYYSPFVEGKGLVIGIGPTRSGKTFFKLAAAAHALKYNCRYVAVDIDAGSEPFAQSLDDSYIFRPFGEGDGGFNVFDGRSVSNEISFKEHVIGLINLMLEVNDEPGARVLAEGDQAQIDAAIAACLGLPDEFKTFSHFATHLNVPLRNKLSRWLASNHGPYAELFDSQVSTPISDSRYQVYNLANLKDTQHLLNVAYRELFFRIRSQFENQENRSTPKFLDIDECHAPLRDPHFQEFVVSGSRTWNKWGVSIGLWTQSPKELAAIENWTAVMSAASTFVFTADNKLDVDLYRETFGLNKGQCDAIRNLQPRKQVYIVQPEIGVSATVSLSTSPVLDAMFTSHPQEAALRGKLVDRYGFAKGIKLAVTGIQDLREKQTDNDTDELAREKIRSELFDS